jgi:YHS domain-containing protein
MPRSRSLLLTLALGAIVLLMATFALAGEENATPVLKRVEAKKVCMVNNQLFEKDQIPIAVEGKTYYGCCEMCKERLGKDAAARTAVDPVTGKKVDKATAVIAAQPDGKVLYFESEKTLAEYQKKK